MEFRGEKLGVKRAPAPRHESGRPPKLEGYGDSPTETVRGGGSAKVRCEAVYWCFRKNAVRRLRERPENLYPHSPLTGHPASPESPHLKVNSPPNSRSISNQLPPSEPTETEK